MKFSIYSELQYWGGKSPARAYEEVVEQVVHVDRLGYDCYAIIEHPFFPKFSISTNPFALYAKCMERTRQIHFRTLGHVLPLHNPMMLASQIAAADILFEGRYELGLVRGHGWHPPKAGVPIEETRGIYDESLEIVLKALGEERFSYDGKYYKIDDAQVVPRPISSRFSIFLGGTSDKTYEMAGENGWGVTVPPLLPYEAMRRQLDIYRETCADHGHDPYIVWIHACYLDDRPGHGRARGGAGDAAVPGGQRLAADRRLHRPSADVLERSGYGFYVSGSSRSWPKRRTSRCSRSTSSGWARPRTSSADRGGPGGLRGPGRGLDHGQPRGFAHWQAIKAQELFADLVIPHFSPSGVAQPAYAYRRSSCGGSS